MIPRRQQFQLIPDTFDTGLFAAYYLNIAGVLLLIWSFSLQYMFQTYSLNLFFVFFFIIAMFLREHDRTARALTLIACGLSVLGCANDIMNLLKFGPGSQIQFFGGNIDNPPLSLALAQPTAELLFSGILLLVLTSAAARYQFAKPLLPAI